MLINLLQNGLDKWAIIEIILALPVVLFALTVHEVSHGLAAYHLGDPTARSRRRLSLNPLRHIDWFGLAMMLLAGFGWAKPVPVDFRYFKYPKKGMAITALAGPVSNLLLAVLAIGVSKVIYLYAPYNQAIDALFVFLLYILAPLSVGLGLFNLLPIPPLDGSKVLVAFLPDRAYLTLMYYERYGLFLLLALSYFGVTGNLISGAIQGVYLWLFGLFY